MKPLNSLKNKNIAGKICLLRVDFNLTEEELKKPLANLRLLRILPTIKFLLGKKAKIVVMSHRGRPEESSKIKNQKSKLPRKNFFEIIRGRQFKNKKFNKKFSLKSFSGVLEKLLNRLVVFIDFQKGFNPVEIKKTIASSDAKIFLLENLRFLPGEEKNDAQFAKKLASVGDFYVNDAFSVSHRKNASVAAITKFLPTKKFYAGFSFENEIENLSRAIEKPRKPLVVILGGAKISDKIAVIANFMDKADCFLLGGVMANTFLAAQNFPLGDSLYEKRSVSTAKQLLKSGKIILPADLIVEKKKILDIGPKTAERYSAIIKTAKTIVWNGPMGYIEDKRFRNGSEKIIKAIIKSNAFAIIGGGETSAIFQMAKIKNQKSKIKNSVFLSTGGGAMLKFLAGGKPPTIEMLQWRKKKTK